MVSPTPSHSARATCRGRQRRVSVPVKYKIDWIVTSNKEDRSCIGHPVPEIQASKDRDRTSHTDFSLIYAHSRLLSLPLEISKAVTHPNTNRAWCCLTFLNKASKGGHPSSDITEPDALAHFFLLLFVKKYTFPGVVTTTTGKSSDWTTR